MFFGSTGSTLVNTTRVGGEQICIYYSSAFTHDISFGINVSIRYDFLTMCLQVDSRAVNDAHAVIYLTNTLLYLNRVIPTNTSNVSQLRFGVKTFLVYKYRIGFLYYSP